jgi:uncharacterized membrane protein SirB2
MDSLYVVDVPYKEYIPMVDDMLRVVCIQVAIQLMLFASGDSQFFTAEFIMLVIYIVLGVALYWLVAKKLVVFK